MTLSVSAGLYYTKSYESILDILAEAGVENLEILLNSSFVNVPINDLKKAVLERNLKVSSVHLPFAKMAYDKGQNEEYWIQKGLEYLAVLGGDTIVTHFFYQKGADRVSNDKFHFPLIEKVTRQNPKTYITTENLLATGELPIKEFIRKLSEKNYQHSLTLEYDFENEKRNPIKSDKEAVLFLRDSLQFIGENL